MYTKSLILLAALAPLALCNGTQATQTDYVESLVQQGMTETAASIFVQARESDSQFIAGTDALMQKYDWSSLTPPALLDAILQHINDVPAADRAEVKSVVESIKTANGDGSDNQRRAAATGNDPDCSGDLSKLTENQRDICESEAEGLVPAAASFLAGIHTTDAIVSDLNFLQTQTIVPSIVTNTDAGFLAILTQIENAATLLPSADRSGFSSFAGELMSLQGTHSIAESAPTLTGFSTATVLSVVTPTSNGSAGLRPSGGLNPSGGPNVGVAGSNNGTLATTARPSTATGGVAPGANDNGAHSSASGAATTGPSSQPTSIHQGAAPRSGSAMGAMGAAIAGLVGVAFCL